MSRLHVKGASPHATWDASIIAVGRLPPLSVNMLSALSTEHLLEQFEHRGLLRVHSVCYTTPFHDALRDLAWFVIYHAFSKYQRTVFGD